MPGLYPHQRQSYFLHKFVYKPIALLPIRALVAAVI